MPGPRLPYFRGERVPEPWADLPDPPRGRSQDGPAVSEAELVHGYSGGVHRPDPLIEPCVCGTSIVCIPDSISVGVRAHNALPEHQRWRDAGGMEAELERRKAART